MKYRMIFCLLLMFCLTSLRSINDNLIPITPLSTEYIKFWSAPYISAVNNEHHTFKLNKDILFIKTTSDYLSNNVEMKIFSGGYLLGSFLLTSNHAQGSHYKINLIEYNIKLEKNIVYNIVLTGKDQRKFQTSIQKTEENESSNINSIVTYNPISIDCELGLKNIVEFAGVVDEGLPPFRYMWLVYKDGNKEKKAFEPKYGKLNNLNEVTQISISSTLGYVVVFAVSDYCGSYKEIEILTECGDGEESGNTIFIENHNTNTGSSSGN